MREPSAGPRPIRATLAALAGSLLSVQLGGTGLAMAAQAYAWAAPDRWVAVAVVCIGAAAGAVLSTGCWLLAVSALAARLNRPALWCGRAGVHLTPALLRRAVGLTVGAGIGVAVLGGVAIAAESDLGWEVTTNQRSNADDAVDPPTGGVGDPSTPLAPEDTGLDASVPDTPTPTPPQVARLRPAEPATGGSNTAAEDDQAQPVGDTVTVQPGDSLWRIAARHLGPAASDAEIATAWPLWFRANRAVIGSDPDLIHPGQVLAPPDATVDAP